MAQTCTDLVATYLTWLKAKITVAEFDSICEITTPFLDRHNDHMQIYVKKTDAGLLLTDDGYTISDLLLSGCDLKSQRRQELLRNILNGFGVRNEGDQLIIEARPYNFPQKKHALLQAMLAVNDMFLTATSMVTRLFSEDVERFLRLNEVRFTPSAQFMGRSGFVHTFHFVIPASRDRPERVMQAINKPNRENATTLIFAWTDTREVRPGDSTIYAVLNDTEKAISSDITGAFAQYDVNVLSWSQRENYAQELAA